jgi:predicted phage baseplate assembly protein
MPIPLPNLDDRRWADLVEDGRAQIPRYAPQWTDHNIHDPGITLIDLFAWLGEMTNYRLNRVPSRHKRKFLQLLGFRIAPPAAAHVTLSFQPAVATPSFVLPAGSEFEGTDPDQKVIPFRTLRDTTVQAAALEAIQVDNGSGITLDRTHDFFDGFAVEALGAQPAPGAALYFGFDSLTPGLPFALGLRFSSPGNDAAERQRILGEADAQRVACQPVRTRFHCVPAADLPPVALPPHHSVVTVWEASTATGWIPVAAVDDTRSLTLDGLVEVTPPAGIAARVWGAVAAPLFYLRCRMTAGVFDAVPVLLGLDVNAAPCEQAIPVTEEFVIKAGIVPTGAAPAGGDAVAMAFTVDARGTIQTLDFGAGSGTPVRVWAYTAPGALAGSITLDVELAGVGTGLPNQQVVLRQSELDAASLEVYTLRGSTWTAWTARPDFDSSSRVDYHFVADFATGTVTFGSGERGQAPDSGSLILIRYRSTAAGTGNVAALTVNRVRKSAVNDTLLAGLAAATRAQLSTMTRQAVSAVDGAAVESLNDALGRAVEVLHAHERLLDLAQTNTTTTLDQVNASAVRALVAPQRGVNLLDMERLALAVPGTRIARAHAWSSLHPSFACLEAPGVVTVIIVPEYPAGMPVPSAGLLDWVWRYLNRRRIVCTTLEVVAPQYVEVTVAAKVQARAGSSATGAGSRIQAALRAYLDPLTGGPDYLGWPFGRSVYRGEILQLMQNIPGVDHVHTMSMTADGGASQCGDLALCPMALARSGAHQIEVS